MTLAEWRSFVPANLEAERPREWWLTTPEAEALARDIVRRAAGNSPHQLRRWITEVFGDVIKACSVMEDVQFSREKAAGLWDLIERKRPVADIAAAMRALEE